jgi:hypothetical protein
MAQSLKKWLENLWLPLKNALIRAVGKKDAPPDEPEHKDANISLSRYQQKLVSPS